MRKEPPGATPIQGNGRERGLGTVLHYETLLARKVSSEFVLAVFKTLLHAHHCRYKRVFCVGSKGITTLNPSTGEITNQVRIAAEGGAEHPSYVNNATVHSQWPYSEFLDIVPSNKANNEFLISMRKGGRKSQQMTFSCEHRAEILTAALVSVFVG